MAKLILKFNNEIVDQIEIKQGDMAIGRRPGSDIMIDNLAVSGNHASIFTVGEDSFIQDLNSTNGTFINNKRAAKHHLKNGDVVAIGKHSLVYVNEKAEKSVDNFTKTVIINPGSRPAVAEPPPAPAMAAAPEKKPAPAAPAPPAEPDRIGAIFILSGANSGKRIDLVAPVTNLGKTGKPAGTISRARGAYVLAAVKGGEVPKLNGTPVSSEGEELKHGDIIEVGDTRMQFNLK